MNDDTNQRNIRKEQIKFLVETYYEKFEFLHDESLEDLCDKAYDKFLDTDLSIEEINEKIIEIILKKKKNNKKNPSEIKDNHKKIYSKLTELIRLLNLEKIDYQLAGSLCGYLKYGEESNRIHDDIDFSINEKDIDKFRKICQSLGLNFEDNRLNSPRILNNGIPSGEHEIIAKDKNSDFHVGVFCFERLADNSIINKGYYHDNDGNPCCREDIIGPEFANEIFNKESITYNGEVIYITPPEYIYFLKSYTKNKKDLEDLAFLEDKIDKDKLDRIIDLSKNNSYTQLVPVNSLPNVYYENYFENKDNDELNNMLATDKIEETLEKDNKEVLEKPKVFQKVSNDIKDESGYASSNVLTSVTMITYVLIFIGIILFMLLLM